MRHDYDLPPDWDALSDTEKSKWMTRERCRRQAKQQVSPTLRDMQSLKERRERILSARGHVSVKEKR